MQFLKLYALAIVAFLVLDGLWLGVVARQFYAKHIGHLFADQIAWQPVAIFYVLYAAGLTYLIIQPGLTKPLASAVLGASIIGLMAYGAYDFTNQATLRDWPWIVTAVDLAWGVFASSAVTAITILFYKYFFS